MTTLTRADKLRRIRQLNDAWVAEHDAAASAAFDSSGRKDGSDYNVHHVELDADGAAQDTYEAAARAILNTGSERRAATVSPSVGVLALARQSQQVLAHAQAFLAAEPDEHLDLLNASRMPVQLRKYWLTHEAWAEHGAFDACVRDLREHGVPGHMVEGACANLHKEATGEWPGQHKGHVSAPFFARVAQSRQRLAKYDPTQTRDDHGKWSAFGGIPAFAKEHLFADGTVSAAVDRGGLQLSLANNAGGSGKSGGLDHDARWELAHQLEIAADWNSGEDGHPGDKPGMDHQAVYTYPEDGDSRSVPSGFAQVGHDGDGNLQLELFDSDEPINLTRAEAKVLADTVRRSAGVSRISLPSGPMDVYPTDDKKVGLRLKAADGSVKELAFDGKSWTRMRSAIGVVEEGYDDMETFVKAVPTADPDFAGDPYVVDFPDVDSVEVDTNVGRLRVSRVGPVAVDDDSGSARVTVEAVDGSWSFTRSGTYKTDESFDAFQKVEEYAGHEQWPGIENSAPRLPSSVAWRPLVAGVKLLPRAEFTEGKHKRDRKGRFAEKNAGQVLSELDELMAKLAGLKKHLGDDENGHVDNALDYLKDARRSHGELVDAGGRDYIGVESEQHGELEMSAHSDGDVSVEWDGGKGLMVSSSTAEELAGILDDLADVDTPWRGGDGASSAVLERRTSDGLLEVVLWDTGTVEVGAPGEVTAEDNGNLMLDPDDLARVSDALEELAHTASGGPVTNLTHGRLVNHPGHPDQSVHNPHKHGRRKLPSLPDTPDVAKPKAPAKKRATRKVSPSKVRPGSRPSPPRESGVDYSAEPWKAPHAERELGSAFHEQWRETRRNADGGFEPRVKTTKDKAWAAQHGTDQVDIANTSYADLPDDWQAENKAAAQTVIELLDLSQGTPLDTADKRNEAGNFIHDAWLKRNEWAKGGELDVPFEELPKDEQDKDIAQYETALKLFRKSKTADKTHRSMRGDAGEA